jgi:PAT family beta-lactamase induction signal transducer AmpG
MVGLSYELESIEESSYSLGSAWVLTGYRAGLLCSGAGALYLSSLFSWNAAYALMAAILMIGAACILFLPEPYKAKQVLRAKRQSFSQYNSLYQGFWREIILEPCRLFLKRADWWIVIFVLLGFKAGDQMMKNMEGVFFLSLGFDKVDIATAAKVWGLSATILGAFCAGYVLRGREALQSLGAVGLLHAATLFGHYLLATIGKSFLIFYSIAALENFTGGMAMTAFIFSLWSVCDKRYASLQYALLWSLYLFKTDLFAWAGAMLASLYSWDAFFLIIGTGSALFAAASWVLLRRKQTVLS